MGHSIESFNEEDQSGLIVDHVDLHEEYRHKLEEKNEESESEQAFGIFEKILSDGKTFKEELEEKYSDLFAEFDSDEERERHIKNKKDKYLFQIYRLSSELSTSIERYVSIVDKFKAFELLIKSGLENKHTVRDLQTTDETRKKLHDKLIACLNNLMIAYDNAGLDNSWRNDIKYDRYNIQVWAELVAKHLHTNE